MLRFFHSSADSGQKLIICLPPKYVHITCLGKAIMYAKSHPSFFILTQRRFNFTSFTNLCITHWFSGSEPIAPNLICHTTISGTMDPTHSDAESDFPPQPVQSLVARIAEILRSRGQTLATSEAACGGLLSAYLVSVPGASDFFLGGKLVYLLRQRLKLSGWSDAEIGSYMGPLEQVALKLARTAKYELGLTYVLSETGFAGPSTALHLGSDRSGEDAVGTVFLGLSGPQGEISCRRVTGSSARAANMEKFALEGLKFLLDCLEGENKV